MEPWSELRVATCAHCHSRTIWFQQRLLYPAATLVPPPNVDLPDDVRADYEEARDIITLSPRGAAALLRLAIQKLCKALGEAGKVINDDIAALVKKGLPVQIQQALDTVRVVGNNAVHPGQLDLKDDPETASALFRLTNIIAEVMITQPKHVKTLYESLVPPGQRDAIKKREAPNTQLQRTARFAPPLNCRVVSQLRSEESMDLVTVLIRAALLFLIGLPLIAAATGTVVSIFSLVRRGPGEGVLAAVLIFAALSAVLTVFAIRAWRQPLPSSPRGAPPWPEPWRRRFTVMSLVIVCLGLAVGALLITRGISPGWLGGVLILVSTAVLASGVAGSRQARNCSNRPQVSIEHLDRVIDRNTALLKRLRILSPVSVILFMVIFRLENLQRFLSVLDVLGVTIFLIVPSLSIDLVTRDLRKARQAFHGRG